VVDSLLRDAKARDACCVRRQAARGEKDMNAIVIEHVKLADLPESWRSKLAVSRNARVTVRIEEETEEPTESAFGMWGDRKDLVDVAGYVRTLRAPRYTRE
jgi:hypothetical protein